jgi:hypothetical protein
MGNLPPKWLLKQEIDTIEFFSEECKKLYEIDVDYKRSVLEALYKKPLL